MQPRGIWPAFANRQPGTLDFTVLPSIERNLGTSSSNQIRHKAELLRLPSQVVGVRVVTRQAHHDELEQSGADRLFEAEVGKQHLAVAHDANEIARAASYAASDAAAAARFQARVSIAALVIAMIALVVSVMTPARIASYVHAQPWLSEILQQLNRSNPPAPNVTEFQSGSR